jgi:hypothetical protein
MNFVNRVKVEHRKDHFVLRFGFSASEDPKESGEETASVAVPLTVASDLLVELFKGSVMGPVEVQEFFADFQVRLGEVNGVAIQAGERGKALQIRQAVLQQAAQQLALATAARIAAAQIPSPHKEGQK